MSALYRNAKKKVSQTELRKFMNEHKNKNKAVQKIESPLAKYSESGQLTCILCQSVVRSEAVWNVHVNAKQHKENVQKAKKLKEQTHNFTAPKRPLTPEPSEPAKRIKGILKNTNANLPQDFFDAPQVKKEEPKPVSEPMEAEEAAEAVENSDTLPEGFFDDPKLDAKARNLEYKDPVEEEWERFQKEIKAVDNKSAEIIAEDQEEATTERQIDEIDEQMRNWSRVLHLERKKSEVKVTVTTEAKDESDEMSEDEDNFDEYLDWRAKKSFK